MATTKTKPFQTTIMAAMQAQDHDIATTAEGAGMHRSSLSRWLSGDRDITATQLLDLMTYLGLDPASTGAPKPKARKPKR